MYSPTTRKGRRIKRRGECHHQENTAPKYNLKREEQKALEELKEDNNRMTLTADKGVSIVIIEKEEYIRKAEELPRQPTHKTIP